MLKEPQAGTRTPMAICDIPEASFLGVVPDILRCSPVTAAGCIPGFSGAWLDTRDNDRILDNISVGSAEEANTVLVRYETGDYQAPEWGTCWLLAFACRAIGIFQPLVRWDQTPTSQTVKEEVMKGVEEETLKKRRVLVCLQQAGLVSSPGRI